MLTFCININIILNTEYDNLGAQDFDLFSFAILGIQVLSLTLDEWSETDMDSMIQVGGNSYANSIYEAFLPKDYPKPKPNSSNEERTKFIRYIFL